MRATRAIGPALGASLVLLLAACGEDTPDTGVDPSSESSPSETSTETPSETPSATPAEPVDFGSEPDVAPKYKNAALRATSGGLITMVPSTLPDGWTTVGGGYQRDPQWWRMEFTAPTGDVVLDQLPGTSDDVLADHAPVPHAERSTSSVAVSPGWSDSTSSLVPGIWSRTTSPVGAVNSIRHHCGSGW